jgi:hypothetical protein
MPPVVEQVAAPRSTQQERHDPLIQKIDGQRLLQQEDTDKPAQEWAIAESSTSGCGFGHLVHGFIGHLRKG